LPQQLSVRLSYCLWRAGRKATVQCVAERSSPQVAVPALWIVPRGLRRPRGRTPFPGAWLGASAITTGAEAGSARGVLAAVRGGSCSRREPSAADRDPDNHVEEAEREIDSTRNQSARGRKTSNHQIVECSHRPGRWHHQRSLLHPLRFEIYRPPASAD